MSIALPESMPAIRKLNRTPGLDWCESVELPNVGPRQVLIKVSHAGICGTDRHIYEWDHWSQDRVKIGITTGHEFVGRVVAIGSAVDRVEIGQRVSGEGHIGCGKCEMCRTGNGHICESVVILGIDCDGCFAPYVAIPEENCWPVSPGISDKIAAVFDPLGNAVHTVMEAGVSGKSVLITGVGIIGLMAVTVARAAGAGKIFVTDMDQKRLDLAIELGADKAFKASENWTQSVLQETHGHGPHVMLEMSGNAQAIRDGFSVLRSGGTAAMLGIPSQPLEIDLAKLIIFKGTKVLGINGRKMFETWYQMENLLLSDRLNLEPIITHVLEMKDYEKGLKMMQSGEAIKVVIKMPE